MCTHRKKNTGGINLKVIVFLFWANPLKIGMYHLCNQKRKEKGIKSTWACWPCIRAPWQPVSYSRPASAGCTMETSRRRAFLTALSRWSCRSQQQHEERPASFEPQLCCLSSQVPSGSRSIFAGSVPASVKWGDNLYLSGSLRLNEVTPKW